MVYNVMIECGFKQEINFQSYTAIKKIMFLESFPTNRAEHMQVSVFLARQFKLTGTVTQHAQSILGSSQLQILLSYKGKPEFHDIT